MKHRLFRTCNVHGAGDKEYHRSEEEAREYLNVHGFMPTEETAYTEVVVDGIRYAGDINYYVEEGESMDSYGEGYEPSLTILEEKED